MKHNWAFWRALYGLAHPVSISAVALLLFNDHWLRRHWPSWWTGKVGDVAWLVFAPLLAAALLAWLVPHHLRQQEKKVARLAFVTTGLGFALVKTLPAAHALAVRALSLLFGGPVNLRRDPSDLLALPALWVGWKVWKRAKSRSASPPRRGWVILSLAALATLANSPPQDDYGIVCLVEQDAQIIAIPGPGLDYPASFWSQDGGVTWEEMPPTPWKAGICPQHRDTWSMSDPADANIQYRFSPGKEVARSQDGGQTWQREIDVSWNEARLIYYERTRFQNRLGQYLGPLDAQFHRPTGNLVIAMGQEGILIRTAGAEWRWIPINRYQRTEIDRLDRIHFLLDGELWLTLILGILILSTLAGRVHPLRWGVWIPAMTWLVWGLLAILWPPAISHETQAVLDSSHIIFFAGAFLSFLGAVPLGLYRTWRLLRVSPFALLVASLIALIGMLLFLSPFLLWAMGVIPFYRIATFIALLSVAGAIWAGDRCVRRFLSVAASTTADDESETEPSVVA